MPAFIPGRELSARFFEEVAAPILRRQFPGLPFSAGLLGYGSDVLGYDDPVSTDHMWGPRFYLFLREEDMSKAPLIMRAFSDWPPIGRSLPKSRRLCAAVRMWGMRPARCWPARG